MLDVKCKKCLKKGEKLFLKGEKCFSSKCPFSRKSARPATRRLLKHPRRGFSEYGLQTKEKQKIKLIYGINERQLLNYVKEVKRKTGQDASAKLYQFLEMRLDNVVFKMGFFDSRSKARQAVSHGHIIVNNKKVDIPSYSVKIGGKISIRPQSINKGIFKDLDIKLKKYNSPAWLKIDKEKKSGEAVGLPLLSDEPGIIHSLNSIIEFYSR